MDTKLLEFSEPLGNAIKVESEGATKLWEETKSLQTQIDKLMEMATKEDSDEEPQKTEVSEKVVTEPNSATS